MGEDRHSRYRWGHARRICRPVRPDHAARVHRHGPGPGVRLRAARVGYGRGAGEWHRLPCARLRRLQQHTRRPSFCADPAGPVRLGRRDARQRARFPGRLCGGLRDRNAHRPRRQLPPLRQGLAPDLKANFGTMTKPLHVGHCARNGVMAAMLARAGMTASHDVFEHQQGFFNVFKGAGKYDAVAVLRDWGEQLDIIRRGIAIKSYPCCGSTHPAIDAMLDLVRAHRLTPENVAHVVSWTHPRRLAHTNRPSLRSALDAKFSVQYCLARALVDGQVVLSHFHDDAYLDARVADVMARIEAAPHPQMLSAGTAHFGAEVTVTTTDGRRLVKVVDSALGRTSEQPLSRFALEAKYRDCAGRVLTPDAVDRSLDLVADMETLDRASVLADTLAAGCACDQAGGPAALARAS